MTTSLSRSKRSLKSFVKLPEMVEIPDLIRVQLDSFEWLCSEGLQKLFEEISPIKDHTGSRLELHFDEYKFEEPQFTVTECLEQGITYSAPLTVNVRLKFMHTGELMEDSLFFGDFPMMAGIT